MAWVDFEPVVYVLRCGNEGAFGDPYEFSATVTIAGTTAYAYGATGGFALKWRHAIRRFLEQRGVKEYRFIHDGREVLIKI